MNIKGLLFVLTCVVAAAGLIAMSYAVEDCPVCPECPAVAEAGEESDVFAVARGNHAALQYAGVVLPPDSVWRIEPTNWHLKTEEFLIRPEKWPGKVYLSSYSRRFTEKDLRAIAAIDGVYYREKDIKYRIGNYDTSIYVGTTFDRREVAAAIMRALDPEGMAEVDRDGE